jgi:hypothetical protein
VTQYLLSLLHFNIQYCVGGLEGVFPSDWDWSEQVLED